MFIRKEYNGYWYIWYMNPETSKRTKLSTKSKNLVRANSVFIKFKKEYESKLNEGINSIPILEFVDIIKNYKKNFISSNSLYYYELELKQFDKFLNSSLKTADIKQKHIDDYLNNLFKENYTLSSAKRKITTLLICLNFAKKTKYISSEINLELPSIKLPQIEKKFINEDDLMKLLEHCNNQDLKDFILVAFMTGMRRSELTNLKWNQIDLEKGFIYLNNINSLTKSRKMRTIPMTLGCIEIIKSRLSKNESPYVFTYKSKEWDNNIRYNFNKLVNQVFGENSKITIHTLRHSFASNLIKKGVEIFTVSKLLGHASVATTQIYSHLAIDTLYDAVKVIDIKHK